MKWRVLPLHTTDAFTSMGIDESVMNAVANNRCDPTIRFWRWSPSTVSIGYFQSMEDEVDVESCVRNKVDIVRRITGGGAVYHDYSGEITYSIVAPESILPKGITESYKVICGWLMEGLKNMGLQPEFKPINDILVSGKKISGNAQTRRNGVVLQHGTILYDLDVVKMFSLLKVSKEKISDKMIKAVEDRVTRILDHKKIPMEDAYKLLMEGFVKDKEWYFGKLSAEEKEGAENLAKSKYSKGEWNFMR